MQYTLCRVYALSLTYYTHYIENTLKKYYHYPMHNVAILGATGTVGQKFISLLNNHPQFQVHELVASTRSAGQPYHQACSWRQHHVIPPAVASKVIKNLYEPLESKIVFSSLDSSIAFEAETHYAEQGHIVISNSKNHRMQPHVPLVIPEINHTHLHAITQQSYYAHAKGAIVTNCNCSTMGLALALAPLHKKFTITKLIVHTLQAISGAGYPGVASMDILGNVIPYISGEEEKMEQETQKILGDYTPQTDFVPADIMISAHCNRVAVPDGHTENVSLAFTHTPSEKDIIAAWNAFQGYPQQHALNLAPERPIWYFEEDNRPQPQLDILHDKGMAVSIGRLRKCNVLDYKFTLLSHNTIRGAAGAAILNAETMLKMDLL